MAGMTAGLRFPGTYRRDYRFFAGSALIGLRWALIGLFLLVNTLSALAAQSTLAPAIALTSEERSWLKAHQPIRLGYMAEYPPYLMTGEKSLQSGIFADLRNALIQTLGIEIVIEEFKRRARWNLKPVKALNL
jgi:hypothetical protein